jgi:hypothetical protein
MERIVKGASKMNKHAISNSLPWNGNGFLSSYVVGTGG